MICYSIYVINLYFKEILNFFAEFYPTNYIIALN